MIQALSHIRKTVEDTVQGARATLESYAVEIEFQSLAEKTHKISLNVFYIVSTAVLYLSNSSVFVIGFAFSILAPETMEKALTRIHNVWNTLTPPIQAGVIIGGIFAWPISMACAAFFVGGYIGNTCQKLPGIENV